MEDVIGILTLGVEYTVVFFLIYVIRGSVVAPRFLVFLFVLLALISLVYWHSKESSEDLVIWRKLIKGSIILGVLFYGVDLVLALVFRQPNSPPAFGGPLGIFFTVLVCPGFTVVCVAGLVRAIYIRRTRM